MGAKKDMILSADTFGLPAGLEIRQILSSQSTKSDKANSAKSASLELRFPGNDLHEVALLAEVNVADDRYLSSPSGQPHQLRCSLPPKPSTGGLPGFKHAQSITE